jgi:hypothetical protein
MCRLYLVVILAILIQACAGVPPTNAPAPTAAATVTYPPTNTATVTTTPTITPSPTIVHIPTFDPFQPTATGIPMPIRVGKFTATPFDPFATPTSSLPGPGFLSVQVTEKNIHWGVCQPNKTKIVAKLENPEDVYSVIVFVQVKSAFKEDYTPWTSGEVMERRVDGTFFYWLPANTTRGHNHYKKSWILFQLVATNDLGEEIGRTKIYTNEISLTPCL